MLQLAILLVVVGIILGALGRAEAREALPVDEWVLWLIRVVVVLGTLMYVLRFYGVVKW